MGLAAVSDAIAEFVELHAEVKSRLTEAGQASAAVFIEETFRKSLALAAASYFEHALTQLLCDFVSRKSGSCEPLVAFFKNKAIKRQYHTYFDWDNGSANVFWSLWGNDFKKETLDVLKSDDAVAGSVSAFLELGKLRNELVHNNYVAFAPELTSDDLYVKYKQALPFIAFVKKRLDSLDVHSADAGIAPQPSHS